MPEDTVSAVPTKILVPIDFSSSSHTALEVATELADKFHAELFLFNVVPESPVVALPEGVSEASIVEAAKAQAEGHFAISKKSLEGEGNHGQDQCRGGYDVVGTVLETIDSEKIDNVVISTHGLLRLVSNGLRFHCRKNDQACSVSGPAAPHAQADKQRQDSLCALDGVVVEALLHADISPCASHQVIALDMAMHLNSAGRKEPPTC